MHSVYIMVIPVKFRSFLKTVSCLIILIFILLPYHKHKLCFRIVFGSTSGYNYRVKKFLCM
jgi:hypothetical protein